MNGIIRNITSGVLCYFYRGYIHNVIEFCVLISSYADKNVRKVSIVTNFEPDLSAREIIKLLLVNRFFVDE